MRDDHRRAPEENARIEQLVEAREQARAQRSFAQADALREAIEALGVELRDTPQGPVWK